MQNIGDSQKMILYADKLWNDSAILVEPGKEYSFSVSNQALWYDASIPSTANGYSRAKLLPFVPFRRNIAVPWFALICTADFKNEFRVFDDSSCFGQTPEKPCSDNSEQQSAICSQSHADFSQSGTLYCYANDVSFMYGNNSGSIEVTVTRTK